MILTPCLSDDFCPPTSSLKSLGYLYTSIVSVIQQGIVSTVRKYGLKMRGSAEKNMSKKLKRRINAPSCVHKVKSWLNINN